MTRLLEIDVEGLRPVGIGPRQRHHSQSYFRIQHGQHRLEQIAAFGRVVVDQQHAIDAHAGLTQLAHRAGLALADLGNTAAAGNIKLHVALASQNANRQRRRLAIEEVEPVKGHLFELLVRRVHVGGPDHDFLSVEILGRAHDGVERIVGGHDERLDLLARFFSALHDSGHQLLIVAVQLRLANLGVPGRADLGGHDDDVGRFGIRLP